MADERQLTVMHGANLPTLQVSPQEWAERRKEFNSWVNTQLRDKVDFGRIPGTDKPTLLKPGAEKIIQAYGCAPEIEVVRRDQDPNTGYLYVEIIVRLVNIQTGAVIGFGVGCCSSYEGKYRWRWEWWNGRGHPPEEEPWEQTRNGKWRRRIENRDLIDTWNTVIKMAKKRALVDAALTISGASEKFTQDVEDFADDYEVAPTRGTAGPQPESIADPPPATATLQKAEPSKPKPVRPYDPETVRQGVRAIAADGAKVKADDGYRGICVGVLDGLFADDDKNVRAAKRHTLSTYLLGKGSSKEWTAGEVVALLKWACNGGDASKVNENAPIEAERIVRQYEAEHGQQELGGAA